MRHRLLCTAPVVALVVGLAPLMAMPAWAQTADLRANSGPDAVSLTIYNGGTALVADTRQIAFSRGEQVVELPGVSSGIRPTTAAFDARGVATLEQNYDFDLLTPSKLMEKAVGEYVEIIRTNPGNGTVERERARVLSVNNGVVVEIDGRLEVLRDDDIPTRVVFPAVPENLRADPTLSITVEADRAGRRDAVLSYLSTGLNWGADYVATFDEGAGDEGAGGEGAGSLDLQGWATLRNDTQTTFRDADVVVVAGEVAGAQQSNTDVYGNYVQPRRRNRNTNEDGLVRAGTQSADVERVGDTYLYPLGEGITVRANQTKQVGIVDATGIAARKVYEFRDYGFNSAGAPQSADVRVSFANSGVALPAGTLRVYGTDASGRTQFLGEDRLGHSPAGSELSLKTGEAFDIRVRPVVERDKRVSPRVRDVSMRYALTNASDTARTVRIVHRASGSRWLSYEVLDESADHVERNAYTRVWAVEVPAQGEAELAFTMRERSRF